MMNCREFIEFLMEYLSERLSPAERAVFEEHIACCPSCVAYLKMYEDTIKLGKAACGCGEEAPPPGDVPEDLIRAILAARPREAK